MSTNTSSIWYSENMDLGNIFCPTQLKLESLDTHIQKTINKGDYVYFKEDYADKIYFIANGSIKIGSINGDGKEITKSILSSGEVFGELALIGIEKRRDFAIAIEKATICIVSVDEMKSMMKDYNSLQTLLMKIMGNRIIEVEQRLESLVFRDSRTRIIEFILNMAKKHGQRVGYETLIRKMLTHQAIANLTATSRQTVTTVLNDLRTKNLLIFDRKRILIRDIEELAKEGGLML